MKNKTKVVKDTSTKFIKAKEVVEASLFRETEPMPMEESLKKVGMLLMRSKIKHPTEGLAAERDYIEQVLEKSGIKRWVKHLTAYNLVCAECYRSKELLLGQVIFDDGECCEVRAHYRGEFEWWQCQGGCNVE